MLREQILAQAQAALRTGHAAECVELCRRLLAQNAGDLEAMQLLTDAFSRTGQMEEAIELCRRILEIDPGSLRALSNLASALRVSCRYSEAVEVAHRHIQLAADGFAGYLNLGLSHLALQDLEPAVEALSMAVKRQPRQPVALLGLGSALCQLGRLVEAEAAYERAVTLAPHERRALHPLARMKLELGKSPEASDLILRIRALRPERPQERLAILRALNDLGEFESAEESLSTLVRDHPEDLEAAKLLAFRYQETGRFSEANDLLRATLQVHPGNGLAYWGLVQGRRLRREDRELVSQMEAALERKNLSAEDRKYLLYALGKSNDDLRQFEVAMTHYEAANALAEEQIPIDERFEVQQCRLEVDRAIAGTAGSLFEAANLTETPVFIVGMMRSGTTLVDQILSSHSRIAGAGELEFWRERAPLIERTLDETGRRRIARDVAAAYALGLQRTVPSALRVTDKKPENFWRLGLIHALLPNARIVHCRRNPIDTCLSIFMNPFRDSPKYAHRREHLVEYYRQYERLMAHWRAAIPADRFLEVDYEELVEQPEAGSRRLIEFCGLEWEDGCLRPELNSRAISTLSLWQVRQPVYKTSVARWRNYELWLGPLKELLN